MICYEIIATAISTLALIVAAIALYKTTKLNALLIDKEERERRLKGRADVTAYLEVENDPFYKIEDQKLSIWNNGPGIARNIRVTFKNGNNILQNETADIITIDEIYPKLEKISYTV